MKLLLLLFYSNILFGQPALKIEYKRSYIGNQPKDYTFWSDGHTDITNSTIELFKVRMLVNDSMAHIHDFRKGYEPLKKKKKVFGEKLVNHGSYLDFINLNYYDECNLDDLPDYLIKKSCDNIQKWEILSRNKKNILGYNCIAALSISENNDSVLVYFTDELKFKKGFLFYEGIPGIVLESFDQRYNEGMHYEAIKVEEIELKLIAPKCENIISCADFKVIMKKRNEKLGGITIIKTTITTIRK